jgi:hypothetical protein
MTIAKLISFLSLTYYEALKNLDSIGSDRVGITHKCRKPDTTIKSNPEFKAIRKRKQPDAPT